RHDAGSTLCQRFGDERVAVAIVAFQGDEQIAGPQRSGIDRNAGGGERDVDPAAGGLPQIPCGPQLGHVPTSRRTTSTSSNGMTVLPIVWPCSWPLPATASTSPDLRPVSASAMARLRSPISRAPGQA